MTHNFKKLYIWQHAFKLCTQIYSLTSTFPAEERYGLQAQIRRSAVSVPSNIAEGCGRDTRNETKRFMNYAIGSNCELEAQLELATHFGYLNKEQGMEFLQEIARNRKMMITFVEKKLKDLGRWDKGVGTAAALGRIAMGSSNIFLR